MLVLTRKLEESIVIDDKITVTILAIEGDKVKLGIEAPREITILRHELYQAIQAQNELEARLATGPEPATFKHLRDILLSEVGEPEGEKGAAQNEPAPAVTPVEQPAEKQALTEAAEETLPAAKS